MDAESRWMNVRGLATHVTQHSWTLNL